MVHKSLHGREQFVWHVDHENVWFYKRGYTNDIKLFTETIHSAFSWFYNERREKPEILECRECREKAYEDRIHAQLHEEQPYLEANNYALETEPEKL